MKLVQCLDGEESDIMMPSPALLSLLSCVFGQRQCSKSLGSEGFGGGERGSGGLEVRV